MSLIQKAHGTVRGLQGPIVALRLIAGICVSLFLGIALPSIGAGQQPLPTLDSYLHRLGYGSIQLRWDKDNYCLVVEAQIEGKSETLLLDTGCTATLVDTRIARKLKTLGETGVQLEDSFGGTITNADTRLLNLKLGAAAFTNQPVEAKSLRHAEEFPQNGILGCDFFFRNFCLIDFGEKKLYVRGAAPPEKAEQALNATLRRSGFLAIELYRTRALVMTCKGKINGQPAAFLVDTGWLWTTIDGGQVGRFHVYKERTSDLLGGLGNIGSAGLGRARVDSLELGTFVLKRVDCGITDLSHWHVGRSDESSVLADGVLGVELFQKYHALIDCHQHKLWLQP